MKTWTLHSNGEERQVCDRCHSAVNRVYGGLCKPCVHDLGYANVYAFDRSVERIRIVRAQIEHERDMEVALNASLRACGVLIMPKLITKIAKRMPAA